MSNLENNTANTVATSNNEATPAVETTKTPKAKAPAKTKAKAPAKKPAKNSIVAEVLKAEAEENETQTEAAPKESAPKISKFEKITSEFCTQNNVSREQLLGYLLKKSVNKKTNLNALAENLMHESFFNKDKMLSEILG